MHARLSQSSFLLHSRPPRPRPRASCATSAVRPTNRRESFFSPSWVVQPPYRVGSRYGSRHLFLPSRSRVEDRDPDPKISIREDLPRREPRIHTKPMKKKENKRKKENGRSTSPEDLEIFPRTHRDLRERFRSPGAASASFSLSQTRATWTCA